MGEADEPELDDPRYDTFLTLVDVYGSADRVAERLRALGVSQDLVDRARRRLDREDAEIERREDG